MSVTPEDQLKFVVAGFLRTLIDAPTYNWGDLDHEQIVTYAWIEDTVEEFAGSIGLPKPNRTST